MRSFTKINYLRKGINQVRFERCGHIILTGKMSSLILGRDLEIKNQKKDIPFSTDIYFLTNRIWFKLNKGLSKKGPLPLSLDIVTKAQIALSSQIGASIDKQYEELQAQYKGGKISKQQAQEYYYNLREKALKPETITAETVDRSMGIIYDNNVDAYLREQSLLREQAREGSEAKKQLNKIKTNYTLRKKKWRKGIIKTSFIVTSVLYWIILILAPFIISYALYLIKTPNDTPLSIIGFVFSIIVELVALRKYRYKDY